MPNRCGACGSAIAEPDDCMECSYGKCKKKYDLACLDINIITFKSYSMSFKKNWVCPECVSLKPKVGNSETPVRINPDFKIYTANTPTNNVTIQRGSQRGSQANLSPTIMDNDSTLLEELREFRADMVARMDSQAKAISLLLNQFSQTKTELDNIVQIMRVLEEKVDAKLSQDKQIQNTIIHEIPDNPPSSTSTFAEVAYQPTGSSKNTYAKKVNKGGATKSALLAENTAGITLLAVDEVKKAEMEENESGWTTVRNKKSRQLKELDLVLSSGFYGEVSVVAADEPLVPVDAYHPPLAVRVPPASAALAEPAARAPAPAASPACVPAAAVRRASGGGGGGGEQCARAA
ncbi:hypothetical protein PYW07_006354 [Mythimna separata]|uniref:Zinc finger PHD-type domain-containing protein n=1 Tax=Mythimna separata TaxID=271217 RepID=A0AAD8DWN7_MYTSE|nr:hypothetical protein PYW07_006354 [Mythimna separata]